MKKNKILILLVIGLSLGSCVQTDDEAFSPEPADKEREKSRQEMEKILGYVDKLNELDTEGVEPLISLFHE